MNNTHTFAGGPTLLRSAAVALAAGLLFTASPSMAQTEVLPGQPGAPYSQMPDLAPIGVRVNRYLPVPDAEISEAIDPAKGYRTQDLGGDLYMVTDNAYQSMFMVYDAGVVVIDAPAVYSAHIKDAVAEVTDRPITHIIYSHSHIDHIGGTSSLGGNPIIIAQEETKRLLVQADDPNRPVPTVTFDDEYRLMVGNQVLELSYHGVAHEPGNIFIYAPQQKVLMVVDVVFPGWMPWRRWALAEDIAGYFAQVAEIDKVPFETLVGGHVSRVGTHADVALQLDFMNDVKAAATAALQTTPFGEELSEADKSNPWAAFDNYIDRVAAQCVDAVTPEWQSKLAGFDVYIWDQCYAMEQSLRID